MKSQLLKKSKILKTMLLFGFFALKLSDTKFIPVINVKMPTTVGILTFISRIVELSMESFITYVLKIHWCDVVSFGKILYPRSLVLVQLLAF